MNRKASNSPALRPAIGLNSVLLLLGLFLGAAQQAWASKALADGNAEFEYSADGGSQGTSYRCELAAVAPDARLRPAAAVFTPSEVAPGAYSVTLKSAAGEVRPSDLPVKYTFQVQAAWYQTGWFRATATLAVFLGLFVAHRLRVRQVTSRVRSQRSDEELERERRYQQFDDALLQGAQGLIWQFHALCERLPEDSPVRVGLADALDVAERTLAEGRARAISLRDAPEF